MNQPLTSFRISVLILLCISCGTLTIAEEQLFPQIFSLPILFFSYVMVDKLNRFHLSNTFGTIAGLIAVGASLLELAGGDGQLSRVFFASHLITYLLWIVLLQKKQPRNYWWLIALSAMQIALSSILTKSIFFGIGVFSYVFVILWTLSIFSVYRASLRVRAAAGNRARQNPSISVANQVPQPVLTQQQKAEVFLSPKASSSRGSIHLDPGENWLNVRLVYGLITICFLSIGVGMVFFTLIPRIWLGSMEFPSSSGEGSPLGGAISGYSEEVKLGDIGEVLESSEPALTVYAFDNDSNEKVNVEQVFRNLGYPEPVFRGSVLDNYTLAGEWKSNSNQVLRNSKRLSGSYPDSIKVQITREDLGTSNLFTIKPGLLSITQNPPDIESNINTGVMRRKKSKKHEVLTYILNVPKSKAQFEDPTSPKKVHNHPTFDIDYKYFGSSQFKSYMGSLLFPESGLEGLAAFTRKLVFDEENRLGKRMTVIERALFLESHLRDSGDYTYTLDLSIVDSSIDPVEDFLFNRKSGHCEYYASALTLMLRAVGISSRLVNGYKGGSTDKETGKFSVEQLHAHAWTEAYDPDHQEWVVFDATPAIARAASVAQIESRSAGSFGSIRSWMNSFWRKQFVTVNLESQKANIYNPVMKKTSGYWQSLFQVRESISSFKDFVLDLIKDPSRLFSASGGIAVFCFLLAISGIVWSLKRLVNVVKNYSSGNRGQSSLKQRSILFYERFLRIISSESYLREHSQTQKEFADDLSTKLSDRGLESAKSQVPLPVTEAFYRVRFGDQILAADEERKLSGMLDDFESSLKEPVFAKRK